MKVNAWILSLMLSLAVVATANAQGGGRGGRGGGMFGGGMFGRTNVFRVASNEAAQKDIGLSNDEIAKVKVVTDDYNAVIRESFSGFANFRDMSEDEQAKARTKAEEASKAAMEKYLPKLKETMSADQFTRLQQITWQGMGTAAFSDAEIIKSLVIAKDQQDKIKAITTEYDGKRGEMFRDAAGGGGGNREGMREKMDELTKEQETKVNEVLTKDQLDKFATLKGKSFDVAQLRGGGRGGFGGGGGGGGGGRGKRPQPKAE